MINKLFTGPFFWLLGTEGDLLSLNPHLQKMADSFQDWSKDSSVFMKGDVELFEDVEIHRDVFAALFADSGDSDLDALTQLELEINFSAMLVLLDGQVKDQIEGGKYAEPSEEIKKIAKSTKKSNV